MMVPMKPSPKKKSPPLAEMFTDEVIVGPKIQIGEVEEEAC
jgi:hypothetical protein